MMEYPKNSLASQNSHLSSVSATHYKHDDSMVVMNAPIKRGELNRETEFKNIKITHIDNELPENVIRELLESHYCRFGPMNVQILKEGFNRTVYVNFESPQDARKAWKDAVTMVSQLLGITARVEPAGLMKSRCPSVKEEKRSRSSSGFGVHASCPDTSVTDEFGRRKEPNREMFPIFRLTMCMPEEKQSVRVLFVGKLKSSISERCLQTAFEQFGPIDSIFIKRHGTYGFKTFAFVRFENAKMAREAKSAMAGYEFDGVPCIVGYGKPVPSRLLWVYGFGAVVSSTWLCKTFMRFGTIEKLLSVSSQETLYVLFTKEESAVEACADLKGQLIDDGKFNRRLEVDFVDPSLLDKYASIGRTLVPPRSVCKQRSRHHVTSGKVRGSFNSSRSSTPERNNSNLSAIGIPKSSEHVIGEPVSLAENDLAVQDSQDSQKAKCKGEECCCKHCNVDPAELSEERFKSLFAKWDQTSGIDCDFGSGMVCKVTEQSLEHFMDVAYESFVQEHKSPQRKRARRDVGGAQRSDGAGRQEKRQRNNSGSSRSTMSLISNEGIESDALHLTIRDLNDLVRQADLCWEGKVTMKRTSCHGQLYMLSGCTRIIQAYLYKENGEPTNLTVSHRFRYKVDGGNPSQWANVIGAMYMLFIPCYPLYSDVKPDELESGGVKAMVKILDEREVAGVAKISALQQPFPLSEHLEDSLLYMFTFSEFSYALFSKLNESITVFEANKDKTVLFVYVPKAL